MSETKHHNVLLLNSPVPLPTFPFPHTLTLLRQPSSETIISPLESATILITAAVRITRDLLTNHARHLELIVCMGTGVDNIDEEACRDLGITLQNTPAKNIASVCEHAFALLAAVKRNVIKMHSITMGGEVWMQRRMMFGEWEKGPPRLNSEEVLGVVGYGSLGQEIHRMGTLLGMKVLVAERKSATTHRSDRTPFAEVLSKATVLILTAPLTPETRNMISTEQLSSMQSSTIIINVGRGEVVNESALAAALKAKTIGGVATDVYQHEPATKENCPLLDEGLANLVLSPHVAWYSQQTLEGARDGIIENLETYLSGKPVNVVVAGRGVEAKA